MAIIFNGKKLAREKEKKLKKEVIALKTKRGITPKLASIVVGEDQASRLYFSLQEKAAGRVGILFGKKVFSPKINPAEIYQYINSLNQDEKVHGIVVQLPLPEKFDSSAVVSKINPEIDVDCLTPENLGLLMQGRPFFLPAVVKAVLTMLKFAFTQGVLPSPPLRWDSRGQFLKGKKVVVVGSSGFVGRPLVAHLKNLGAEVIPCDEFTRDLGKWTKRGDILISATGIPGLIKREMVREEAIVIDVGSPKGDVDFEEVKKVASFITPVPGGVGPLTIVCLLENTLQSAYWLLESSK